MRLIMSVLALAERHGENRETLLDLNMIIRRANQSVDLVGFRCL